MKKIRIKLLLLAVAAFALALGGFMMGSKNGQAQNSVVKPYAGPRFADDVTFPKDTAFIQTKDSNLQRFDIEIATTPQQHAKGLMFRTEMAEDAGMLFFFPQVSELSFWMKNTVIPLDMIFIDGDGTINHIHKNAKPHDLTKIGSDKPSRAVLELNGGATDKFDIQVGDSVQHRYFGNAVQKEMQ